MSTAAKLAEALEAFRTSSHALEDGTPMHIAIAAELRRLAVVEAVRDQLRAALAAHRAEQADPWRDAVDNELAVCELTVDNYPTPRAAVRSLIDWHCSVQIDPAVSSAAQALIDAGYRRGVEDAAAVCDSEYRSGIDDDLSGHGLELADAIRALIKDKP